MLIRIFSKHCIRVYPKKTKRAYAAMRMELIGCKADCVKSMGACSNTIPGVDKLQNSAFSASSFASGNEPYLGRVAYSDFVPHFEKSDRKLHSVTVFGPESAMKFENANEKCQSIAGSSSGGALVSIHSQDDHDNVRYRIQQDSQVGCSVRLKPDFDDR